MPAYSFLCDDCHHNFEVICSIRDYSESPMCEQCKSRNTARNYTIDMATLSTSIRKSDSELKTLGDIAQRNSDRMSNDEKQHLYNKHNDYKENKPDNPLPKGMSRIKKPKKGA